MQLLQIGDHIIQAHNFLGLTVSTSSISMIDDMYVDSYEAHWEWGNETRSQVIHSYEYREDADHHRQKYIALGQISKVVN